jgi:endoglucanase
MEKDGKKPIKAIDMFIDIVCSSQKEVEALGILAGAPISIDRTFAPCAGT